MNEPREPVPMVPRLILGGLILLLLSWVAFMTHYIVVGHKARPQPTGLILEGTRPDR